MIPVSALAGEAHSRATKAPISHILRFMAWRSSPPSDCVPRNFLSRLRFRLQTLSSTFPRDLSARTDGFSSLPSRAHLAVNLYYQVSGLTNAANPPRRQIVRRTGRAKASPARPT